jgi:hypothetical protein
MLMHDRRAGAMSGIGKPDLPPRPSTLERISQSSRKTRTSSLVGTGYVKYKITIFKHTI